MRQQRHLQAREERAVCVKWWRTEEDGISDVNLMYVIVFHANLLLAKIHKMMLQRRMSSLTN